MNRILKKKQQKGSVLVFTLIVSVVVFISISAYIYSSRINLFSSKSLTENSQQNLLYDSYTDLYVSKMESGIENFSVNNTTATIDKSTISQVFYNFNNIKQYESEALNSYNLNYKIYDDNGNIISSKNILFNQAINPVFYDYGENQIPISIPYININNFTDSEKSYRLHWDGSLIDTEQGYIGYFELGSIYSELNLIVNGVTRVITLPINITDSHQITIGWDLKYGKWYLHLAIFNNDDIYVSDTSLESILDTSSTQAITNLEDMQQLDILDGSSGNIIDVKFINDVAYTPSILIFRGTDDTYLTYSVRYHDLYKSSYIGTGYNNPTQLDRLDEDVGASYNSITDFASISNSEILYSLAIVDSNYSLRAEKAVIIMTPKWDVIDLFYDDVDPQSFIYDFVNNELIELVGSITISDGDNLERPINIVKKDDDSFYIETFSGKHIYRYLYTGGLSTLETFEKTYNEYIKAVIPKYGYSFVITDTDYYLSNYDYYKLYQYDYASKEIVQEMNLTEEPHVNQIFFDKTTNEFYVQKYGLQSYLGISYNDYTKDEINQNYLNGFGIVHIS